MSFLRTPVAPLGGVALKSAEATTLRLLPTHAPMYSVAPQPPAEQERLNDFLNGSGFRGLHAALDPGGGGNVPGPRGSRKRAQVTNMVGALCVLAPAVRRKGRSTQRTMVDFCGGCGHVGLVLAALYPAWTVVIVDMKKAALAVVKKRAEETSLSNVRTWLGKVHEYDGVLDIGLALHACGSASDDVLAACVREGAMAVISPCCVGAVASPRAYARECRDKVEYIAQSAHFRGALNSQEYGALVRAADYGETRHGQDLWRTASKALVEHDRILRLREQGYDARLLKMYPLDCTPKNDIIITWPQGKIQTKFAEDVKAMQFLERATSSVTMDYFPPAQVEHVEREIEKHVLADGSAGVWTPRCVRGARERKLVHAVADRLGLQHASEGRGSNRRVRVWRSSHWPVYFHHYIGVAGRAVQKAGEQISANAPVNAVRERESKRGVAYHVTLLGPKELGGRDSVALLDSAFSALKGSTFTVKGLGKCEDFGRTAWFAVVEWEDAQRWRESWGFPPMDFHITVGFDGGDVYTQAKDESTLIKQYSFECDPWE